MVKAYKFPKGLVRRGCKAPRFVWVESIYKDEPGVLINTALIQGEEGTITLDGNEEWGRRTEWGTMCHWCGEKFYLDNMLIILDEDGTKSVMCPSCYKGIVGAKAALATQ